MSRSKGGSRIRQERGTKKAEEKGIFESGEQRQFRDERFEGSLAYSVAEVVAIWKLNGFCLFDLQD